jgi:hypothetical protein
MSTSASGSMLSVVVVCMLQYAENKYMFRCLLWCLDGM